MRNRKLLQREQRRREGYYAQKVFTTHIQAIPLSYFFLFPPLNIDYFKYLRPNSSLARETVADLQY